MLEENKTILTQVELLQRHETLKEILKYEDDRERKKEEKTIIPVLNHLEEKREEENHAKRFFSEKIIPIQFPFETKKTFSKPSVVETQYTKETPNGLIQINMDLYQKEWNQFGNSLGIYEENLGNILDLINDDDDPEPLNLLDESGFDKKHIVKKI